MSEPRAFTDNEGSPLLVDSIALFLDGLGTQERASKLKSTDLASLQDARRRFNYMLENDAVSHIQRSLSFTDNIVVGYASTDWVELVRACFNASTYQLAMTLQGQLIRGGVTQGPLYIGEAFAHGQALIDAYRLESSVARYPRIVLSPGLRRRLVGAREDDIRPDVSRRVLGDLFVIDSDQEVFLDYLCASSSLNALRIELGLSLEAALERHRELIVRGLYEGPERVRDKYLWMADYHDWAADQLKATVPMPPDYRADRDPDPRTLTRWTLEGT